MSVDPSFRPAGPWRIPQPPPQQQHYVDVHLQAAAEQPWQADLRRQAVDRMLRMSINHAQHVWQRRFSDPIGPHALALLYKQPTAGTRHSVAPAGQFTLTAAWRLWLDGPEVADLATLLFQLHHQLAPRAATQGFDVRAGLPITAADHDQSPLAVYTGVAVTSLDTPELSWSDARLVAATAEDLGSFIHIVLEDGTVITVDRRGFSQFNSRRIRCSHSLSFPNGDSPYPWTRTTVRQLQPDPDDDRNPLKWLIALGDTCAQADARRVVNGHDRRQR